MRKRTTYLEDVEGVDCELTFEPVEWIGRHKAKVGDKYVVAYCVQDNDYRDVDDMMGDCMGKLYSFHRHASHDDHSNGLEALGNTRDGERDLDSVWDKHWKVATERLIARLRMKHELADIAAMYDGTQYEDTYQDQEAYVDKCLRADCNDNDWYNVMYSDDLEAVLCEMWSEPAYFPGDKDAQLLACYSHGGQVWSLSGSGTQCRWDTSNSAGVWVPDDCLRQQLDDAAPQAVWAFVRNTNWIRGTGKSYQLVTVSWENGVTPKLESADFSDDPSELYARAEAIAALMPAPTPHQLAWGRTQQAEIYCKQFLNTYNDIISGNVFGCVAEWFDEDGTSIDHESCWGFIGDDHAKDALKSEFFDPVCARLAKEVPAEAGV